MHRRDLLRLTAALTAGYLARPSLAFAQSKYPSRPIRLVVPYPPGGVVDVVARQWADKMKRLGTVVVENQAGGGGTIGASAVARGNADGYNLLFGETSCLIISPSLMKQPPYDPVKDFSPISMIFTSSTSIVVHPSIPATNLQEFITFAKANQDKISYASAGAGTVTHLAGELFKQLIGTPHILHVPYRGAGPAIIDVMAGVVPMSTPNITSQILSFHRAGKLRILAVCAPARLKAAPEIPAASEVLPGMIMQLNGGVQAPAATPASIVAELAKATAEIAKDPDFDKALQVSGLELRSDLTPAGAKSFLTQERQRLLPIMHSAGLEPQ